MGCTSTIPSIVSIHSMFGKHVLLHNSYHIDNPEDWEWVEENLWFNVKEMLYASVALEGYKRDQDFRSYINQKILFNRKVCEMIKHHTSE